MANSQAVEAVWSKLKALGWVEALDPEAIRADIARALDDAEPIIRKSEQERIREALSQPIHDLASTIGRARVAVDDGACGLAADELTDAADAMGRLRNALSALDSEQVEGAAGHDAKPIGWSLIHQIHGVRGKVDVCLGEETHVWGYPETITDTSFVLIDPQGAKRWRHEVAWDAVKGARVVEAPADVVGTCPNCKAPRAPHEGGETR